MNIGSTMRLQAIQFALAAVLVLLSCIVRAETPAWISPCRYRVLLEVEPQRGGRSNSPATVALEPDSILTQLGAQGEFDPATLEVVAYDSLGAPSVYDRSRRGYERYLLPHRFDVDWKLSKGQLHFVIPDQLQTTVAVYLDTKQSSLGRAERYLGPVGDGDYLRQSFGRREIGATHFDAMTDLDADGDLDLVSGGVEPFLYCFENVGQQRLVPRGRLTSGRSLLTLPHNPANGRSWVVPHFHDLDRDGDQDLLASFMDGPHARRIVLFERTSQRDEPPRYLDRGALMTGSGTAIAGGEQAGGWFPSVALIDGHDESGQPTLDLVVGSNNHAYFYQSLGRDSSGRWRWDDAVTLVAGQSAIELFNPCFEVADVDADGNWDLLAAPQSGQILLYRSRGPGSDTESKLPSGAPRVPSFEPGVVVAYDEMYLQRSTHPRVTAADFTGDGLIDLVVDRAWELTDLRSEETQLRRDHGALFQNVGSKTEPRWQRRDADHGAPYTELYQPCDAVRQNVVRVVDWNDDGRLDLLTGDCDGFIWCFLNRGSHRAPLFEAPWKLRAGGKLLSLADRSGHARPTISDWNNDGRWDLVVADGAGGVTVYLNRGSRDTPRFDAGERLLAEESDGTLRPIQRGTRAHVLVADWNADGKKDLIFSDQENPGFWWLENKATDNSPRLAKPQRLPLTPYVRPNLGSLVDWDGDGRQDLVACEFEHSIRLYRNRADRSTGEEPVFDDPDGSYLIKPSSIMMISGADVIDFNADGDLDVLTGQGHGGSGVRFFERDFIDDQLNETQPVVQFRSAENQSSSLLETVRRYADAMLQHGRDVYGRQHSQLFLSALDRRQLQPLSIRPAPPGGIRRGDRAGLPWQKLVGANPHNDENLLRLMYSLSEVTNDPQYANAADHQIQWFFQHAQSPVTGLMAWGEHMSWDVMLDRPIASGDELVHEFARPWLMWDRTFAVAPDAAKRFAIGLWEHQIADHQTGAFDRHAPFDRHGPRDGRDFPRHAGFYIHTWAHAYQYTQDPVFLRAIETVLARFERKRTDASGVVHSTIGPLDVWTAAQLVPDPLATRLKDFADKEDELVLGEIQQYRQPDGSLRFQANWQAGYAAGATIDLAMFALARWQQTQAHEYRQLVLALADAYVDALPDEDVDVWPMTLSHVISAQVAAYRMSNDLVYLQQAGRFATLAVDLYWQDSPLPRASLKTDHYETITGGDSLALSLLEVHAVRNGLSVQVPANTIDR